VSQGRRLIAPTCPRQYTQIDYRVLRSRARFFKLYFKAQMFTVIGKRFGYLLLNFKLTIAIYLKNYIKK